MKLGFDLDGVIADAIIEFWEEGQMLGLIPKDANLEDLQGRMDDMFEIDHDGICKMLAECVYERMQPIKHTIVDVRRWIDADHDIIYITARCSNTTPRIERITEKWLDNHGILDGTDGVIHVSTSDKWRVARDLNLTTFVDDSPKAIRPMVNVIPYPFLLATPQNTSVNDIKRWKWDEISSEIDRLLTTQEVVG